MRSSCKIHQPNGRAGNLRPAGLVVGGYDCPQTGETASSDIPSDHRYFITMFGGGSDAQNVACTGMPRADGTWYYVADRQRFGCGTKLRISNPATGTSVIAQVADYGPNICVEQAAGGPIIDASPLVVQALFGVSSYGWEDRKAVIADVVDPSTPLGPEGGVNLGTMMANQTNVVIGLLAVTVLAVGSYYAFEAYQRGDLQRFAQNTFGVRAQANPRPLRRRRR